MADSLTATVVLSTRNEKGAIGSLLRELHAVAETGGQRFEAIVVDDSDLRSDGVNQTLDAVDLVRRDLEGSPHIDIRSHHRPAGQRPGQLSGAMAVGLNEARGPIIVFKDGDGQHPPTVLPALLEKIEAGHDIVVGSRYRRGGSNAGLDGLFRRFVSRAATTLTKILFPHALRGVSDPMSGCFAVRRGAIDPARLNPTGFKFLLDALVSHTHLRRAEVPLQFRAREDGESKAGEGNGTAFLKQLPALRLRTLPTSVNFAFGGALSAVLGILLFWGFVHAGISPRVANPVELLLTLLANFLYCRAVTFRGQSRDTLVHQAALFLTFRGAVQVVSWFAFSWLISRGVYYQAANLGSIASGVVLNYPLTKLIFTRAKGRHRVHMRRLPWKLVLAIAVPIVLLGTTVEYAGVRAPLFWMILLYSIFNLVSSSMEVRWRLYGRRDPEARAAMRFPEAVHPSKSNVKFSLIVPALREAAVIGYTLRMLLMQTHPDFEIVVSLVEGDSDTIRAAAAVEAESGGRIRLVIKAYTNGSKPKQLNAALRFCRGEIVGVFDAEDVVPKDLLLHVEALFAKTDADVVQGGVQLTNPDLQMPEGVRFFQRQWIKARGWFAVHNVLEYYFWFSSRMMYQVAQGFVPLGGNTVFVRRELLVEVGGWPLSLTEDCALGVLLSVKYGAKVVAAYESRLATREETPSHIWGKGGFFRQRVRWDQGFLKVLLEGQWRKLPTLRQRLMALYILGMPFIQALNGVMFPVSLAALFLLVGPVGLVLIMFTPFVPILMTLCLQVVGLREFSQQFDEKVTLRHYASVIFLSYPYQVILTLAALMSIIRLILGRDGWSKTAHVGVNLRQKVGEPIGVPVAATVVDGSAA